MSGSLLLKHPKNSDEYYLEIADDYYCQYNIFRDYQCWMRSDFSMNDRQVSEMPSQTGIYLAAYISIAYHASGNLFKCHEEVLYLQPLIPPKRFDIFSP